MQAIETKYIGPTDTKGGRIVARCEAKRIIRDVDHALGIEDRHTAVARELIGLLGWYGHGGGVARPRRTPTAMSTCATSATITTTWTETSGARKVRPRASTCGRRQKGRSDMEIDITHFVTSEETWGYSGSIATHGPNAGPLTWANAMRRAGEEPVMLDTEDKLDAMRQWIKESGGWDDAEREAMDAVSLNAMFIQLVTSEMREIGLEDSSPEDFDWATYQERAEAGQVAGDIFGDGFGKIFFYLGI